MARSATDVFIAALELPAENRRNLVEVLLDSLPDPDADADEVERAWKEEVERRIQAIKNGTAKLIPAEEVFSRLRREDKER